jgi:ABC-type transport system involved in multi-copper enzyme maturation permease subunit
MRQLAAITRREIGSFFHGITATMVLTGFLVIVGLVFALGFVKYSDMSLTAAQSARSGNYLNLAEGIFRPLVSSLTVFLVLLLPAVTMRLFSPEYTSGRQDLIASWPVPDHVWVVGKWLSALVVAAVMLATSLIYFGSVWLFGQPEAGPMLTGLLGLLLLGASLTAWGTLGSVLFRQQIVAMLVSLLLTFLLLFFHLLERFLPGILGRFASEMSLLTHFEKFSRGLIDTRDLLYFVLMTAVPLFLAAGVLGGRRLPARRRLPQGLPALLAVALAMVLYTIGLSFPATFDLTGNKRYSLAPQTVRILDSLDSELADGKQVEVIAFYQRHDPAYDLTEVLLKSCEQHSPRFRYRMVDPVENLDLTRQYGITLARTMAVQAGDDFVTVLQPTESGLINAVYRLVSGTRPIIGYLQGHGEHRLDSDEMPGYSSLALELREQGYDLRPLFLAEIEKIPSTCDVLVIAGPRTEPDPAEIAMLDEFVDRGGAVLAMFDPPTPRGWQDWLVQFKIWLSGGVLISADGAGAEFGTGPRSVVVTQGYGGHEITRPMLGVSTLFPMSQALGVVPDEEGRVKGDLLLVTGELSWVEGDPATMYTGRATFERGVDVAGPHPLAVVMEVGPPSAAADSTGAVPTAPAAGKKARAVVMGNSEWLNNSNINLGGNRDLLLNTIGWLAREETLIELRGRDPLSQPVILSASQRKAMLWGAPLIWPLFVGSLTLVVMLRHRRQSQGSS